MDGIPELFVLALSLVWFAGATPDYGHGGFLQQEPKSPGAIKLTQPFPAPELRAKNDGLASLTCPGSGLTSHS